MRGYWIIVAAALVACLLAEPAVAQTRQLPLPPQHPAPATRPQPHNNLPPSDAINRAMSKNPGSRPLGLVPNGNGFNVRLKQGNRVIVVPVAPGN